MLRRLLKETLTYSIGGIISRLIGIFLIPIYTRVLTPEQFGLFDILLVTSSVLVLIGGLQVESGIGRGYFEAKGKNQHRLLVGTGLILCFSGAAACWIVLLFAYPFLPPSWIGNEHSFLLAVALGILPTQLLNVAQMVLRLEHKLERFLILSIGDVLTTSFLCIGLVVYGHWGVGGVMWSLFISKLLWTIIAAVWLRSTYALHFDRAYANGILAYGLPTIPGGLVAWSHSAASRYILASTISLSEVGIFGLATRIGSPVSMLMTAFRSAWYPQSVELMGNQEFKTRCVRVLDIYWMIGFPICALLAASGDLMVFLLASESYMPAGRLVGFVVMGILWTGAQQIVGLGSDFVRKPYLTVVAYSGGVAANIGLLFITIHQGGVVSVAIASLFGYIVTTLLHLGLSQKQFWMPYHYRMIILMGICSLTFSWVCLLSPPTGSTLRAVLAYTLQKYAVAIALCAVIVLIGSTNEDRLKAKAWMTSLRLRQ